MLICLLQDKGLANSVKVSGVCGGIVSDSIWKGQRTNSGREEKILCQEKASGEH